jgi:beta-N-acetylhexosaminidase
VDSHLELPRIERSADKIWTEDLAPYRALREDLPMVMVGHAHYPSLQGREPSPATLSRKVVHDLLRTGIPFSGLILTDDLEMGAVDQRRSPGDVALEALHAGNDLLMFCKSWERIVQAHGAIVRALATGTLSRSRVDESLARIRSLKTKLPVPAEASPFDPAGFTQVCRDLARLERATGA